MENSTEAQRSYLKPGAGKALADREAEKDRWAREFATAKKWLKPWQEQAKKIESIVRDEREANEEEGARDVHGERGVEDFRRAAKAGSVSVRISTIRRFSSLSKYA